MEAIRCPPGQREAVVKYGRASNGKERFRCQHVEQGGRTVIRASAYPGRTPEGKQQIIEMTLKGSGGRDSARVLQVSPSTVMGEVKKRRVRSPRSIKSSWRGAVPTRLP
jgi:transposase-like protein